MAEPTPQDASHGLSSLGYFGIYLALMALLGLTVAAARIDLGAWNLPVSLFIACLKAFLIMMFFMHLRESRGSTVFFAFIGIVWLVIMYALAFGDYLTRVGIGA